MCSIRTIRARSAPTILASTSAPLCRPGGGDIALRSWPPGQADRGRTVLRRWKHILFPDVRRGQRRSLPDAQSSDHRRRLARTRAQLIRRAEAAGASRLDGRACYKIVSFTLEQARLNPAVGQRVPECAAHSGLPMPTGCRVCGKLTPFFKRLRSQMPYSSRRMLRGPATILYSKASEDGFATESLASRPADQLGRERQLLLQEKGLLAGRQGVEPR